MCTSLVGQTQPPTDETSTKHGDTTSPASNSTHGSFDDEYWLDEVWKKLNLNLFVTVELIRINLTNANDMLALACWEGKV